MNNNIVKLLLVGSNNQTQKGIIVKGKSKDFSSKFKSKIKDFGLNGELVEKILSKYFASDKKDSMENNDKVSLIKKLKRNGKKETENLIPLGILNNIDISNNSLKNKLLSKKVKGNKVFDNDNSKVIEIFLNGKVKDVKNHDFKKNEINLKGNKTHNKSEKVTDKIKTSLNIEKNIEKETIVKPEKGSANNQSHNTKNGYINGKYQINSEELKNSDEVFDKNIHELFKEKNNSEKMSTLKLNSLKNIKNFSESFISAEKQSHEIKEYTKIIDTKAPISSKNGQPDFNEFVKEIKHRVLDNGETKLNISLRPEHFGKLDIVASLKDGKLEIIFKAESSHAREWLNGHIQQFKDGIEKQGIQLSKFDVRDEAGEGRGEHQEQRGRDQGKRKHEPEDKEEQTRGEENG